MQDKITDVAILGGGLAGLTLAIQLANAGHSVILFEKEKYPFHKVCGEYVSFESYDFLERIGIPLSLMDLPIIEKLRVSAPNGTLLEQTLDLGGFGISRFYLDSKLAELAVSKGVKLYDETKALDVQFENDLFLIKTESDTYKALVVSGSFGKHSNLEKKIDKNLFNKNKNLNYIGVKYHVHIDLPENVIELHNFKDGYCGISKIEDGKFCLCYLTDSKNLKDNDNDIKKMETHVLMKNSFLKKYFETAEFIFEKPLTISQIGFHKRYAVKNHVLMVGDAAGTIAPLCGNGMSMAMHASFIAFGLIDKYLHGDLIRSNMEALYEKQWKKLFSRRIWIGRSIQQLFGAESQTNISIGILKRLPFLTGKLIKLTHGNKF